MHAKAVVEIIGEACFRKIFTRSANDLLKTTHPGWPIRKPAQPFLRKNV